jgi:hypothetical protein
MYVIPGWREPPHPESRTTESKCFHGVHGFRARAFGAPRNDFDRVVRRLNENKL